MCVASTLLPRRRVDEDLTASICYRYTISPLSVVYYLGTSFVDERRGPIHFRLLDKHIHSR